jgi:hypothetical protein
MDLSIHKYSDYRHYIGDAADSGGGGVIAKNSDFYRHFVVLRRLVVAVVAAAASYRSIGLTDLNFCAADRWARFVTCRNQLVSAAAAVVVVGVVVVPAAVDFEIYLARFELLMKPTSRVLVEAAAVAADDLVKANK